MKKVLAIALSVLMCIGCFPLVSFAAEATDHLAEVPEGYVGVYTKDDLDYVRMNMSGKYILMNDIVFEDKDFEKGGDFYNSGKGWEPIGTSSTNFKGTFDGNGYAIKNLYINAPEQDYIGLFGYASGTIIRNLTLDKTDVTGRNYTGGVTGYTYGGKIVDCILNGYVIGVDYIGGIVGYILSGTINNSICSASVNGKNFVGGIAGCSYNSSNISECISLGNVTGVSYIGGIAGKQSGYVTYGSSSFQNEITKCSNSSTIKADSFAGGIAGSSENDIYQSSGTGSSIISYCYNSGDVFVANNNAGGIVGYITGAYHKNYYGNIYITEYYLSDCFNCGDISSSDYVGGLVGKCGVYTYVENSYSTGVVTATSNFGGCFGISPNKATFCYYLDESVVEPTCISGTAKSADQLRRATAYEQWDFTNIWTMEGREDYPYPELINIPLVLPGDFHEHDYKSKVTTSATHTSTGVMTYTCECGDSYTETIEKTAEHSYSSVVTDPTCTEQGYTTYTCACGDSYKADYVTENGHTDGEWTVTKPATTTATGTKTQSCSVCGEVIRTETIPMLPAKVYGVSVSDVSLDYKATATITPAVKADKGANYTVTYSSSDPSVANVDANGKVTATGTGNATIICTVKDTQGNTVTDTCEVEVKYNWWQWIIVIVLFGWIWY